MKIHKEDRGIRNLGLRITFPLSRLEVPCSGCVSERFCSRRKPGRRKTRWPVQQLRRSLLQRSWVVSTCFNMFQPIKSKKQNISKFNGSSQLWLQVIMWCYDLYWFLIQSVSISIIIIYNSGVEKVDFGPCSQQAKQMAGDGLLWMILWRLILCLPILPLLARPTCNAFTMAMQESKKFFITRAYLRGATEQYDQITAFFCKTTPVETLSENWARKDRKGMLKGLNKLKRTLWVVLRTQSFWRTSRFAQSSVHRQSALPTFSI